MHTCGTYIRVCMSCICMYTHTRYMKVRITCATVNVKIRYLGLLNSPRLYLQILHVYRYTGSPHSGNRLILTFTYMYVYIHVCTPYLLTFSKFCNNSALSHR